MKELIKVVLLVVFFLGENACGGFFLQHIMVQKKHTHKKCGKSNV